MVNSQRVLFNDVHLISITEIQQAPNKCPQLPPQTIIFFSHYCTNLHSRRISLREKKFLRD